MLPGDEIRSFVVPECVLFSCWFWGARFASTLHMKNADYRLNGHISDIINEVFTMARKPVKKESSYAQSNASSVGWINVALTDEDVGSIERWLADEPDLLIEVVRLVSSGYAVGVKPAREGDGYMATIISSDLGDGRGSMGLSAYAASPFDALGVLLYKFVSRLGGEFPTTGSPSRSKYR